MLKNVASIACALVLSFTIASVVFAKGGVTTANGWYEGEEIYPVGVA